MLLGVTRKRVLQLVLVSEGGIHFVRGGFHLVVILFVRGTNARGRGCGTVRLLRRLRRATNLTSSNLAATTITFSVKFWRGNELSR
jgi:hypothetical protein